MGSSGALHRRVRASSRGYRQVRSQVARRLDRDRPLRYHDRAFRRSCRRVLPSLAEGNRGRLGTRHAVSLRCGGGLGSVTAARTLSPRSPSRTAAYTPQHTSPICPIQPQASAGPSFPEFARPLPTLPHPRFDTVDVIDYNSPIFTDRGLRCCRGDLAAGQSGRGLETRIWGWAIRGYLCVAYVWVPTCCELRKDA